MPTADRLLTRTGGGALDQRITLSTPDTTRDALGQDALTWTFLAEVWAQVAEVPGREFLKGDYQAEEKAVFVIRWREIDSTAQVTWRGRTWRIESVTGTRRSGFASLHCKTDGAT